MIKYVDQATLNKAIFIVNKINVKFVLLFFFIAFALFSFFGKANFAHAAYQYENIEFYAQANPAAYAQEGTAFYAPTSQVDGSIPVYRSFSSSIGNHLYTTSDSEKNAPGFSYEGIAFYAFASQVSGTAPVYRFYSSTTGDHFYSASDAEKTALVNNPQWGYAYEGVAFYVYANQTDGASPVYRFYNSSTGDHFYTAAADEKG